jgi:hypothetical protein
MGTLRLGCWWGAPAPSQEARQHHVSAGLAERVRSRPVIGHSSSTGTAAFGSDMFNGRVQLRLDTPSLRLSTGCAGLSWITGATGLVHELVRDTAGTGIRRSLQPPFYPEIRSGELYSFLKVVK